MSRANRKPRRNNGKVTTLDQWVEIEVRDGITVTTLYPDNDEMLRLAVKREPEPELIYRRLFFVNGIPPEYGWATRDPALIACGGAGIVRFRFIDWVRHIRTETAGHLRPFLFPMPRPQERGGCNCPCCTAATERIERTGR